MKNDLDKWRYRLFIGGLVIIAFVINAKFDFSSRKNAPSIPSHESQQKAESKSSPAKDQRAEIAEFAAKYFNANLIRKPGTKVVGIAVASEDAKSNFAVNTALADHLKTETTELVPSFLKSGFVADGIINQTFDDGGEALRKLNLSKAVDGILLARQQVEYSTNTTLENVITANMRLEVALFPLSENISHRAWTLVANGAGFRPGDARLQAEERLIKEIANDTNMIVAP